MCERYLSLSLSHKHNLAAVLIFYAGFETDLWLCFSVAELICFSFSIQLNINNFCALFIHLSLS